MGDDFEDESSVYSLSSAESSSYKVIPCRFCDKEFKSTHSIIDHYQSEHRFIHSKYQQMQKDQRKEKERNKMKILQKKRKNNWDDIEERERKRFKCEYCKYSTNNSCDLKKHIRIHTGERPFKCKEPGCNMKFRQRAHLKNHSQTHSSEKPYKCSYNGCNKTFKLKNSYNRHCTLHVEDDKKYKCTFCRQAFETRKELNVHVRIHTEQKPFECMYCNKRFSQSHKLKKHVNRQH